MKKLILSLVLYLAVTVSASAQADRITQADSIKSGRKTVTFTINSRHNYNTVQFDSLSSTDSIKISHLNEEGKLYPVALRNLNTWYDWEGNIIFGLSGRYEFLVLHPNLYKLVVEYLNVSPSKTIDLGRRGNNLK